MNNEEITMRYRNLILSAIMMVGVLFGQVVTGFVGEGDKPLVGANVVVEGTTKVELRIVKVNLLSILVLVLLI